MRPAKSSERPNGSTRSSPRSTGGTPGGRSGCDAVTGQGTLALDAETTSPVGRGGERLVEVAVDAVGAGGARTYTYAVPERLADLEPGEVVLVDFGARQAVGICLRDADAVPAVEARPIVDKVR